MSDIFRDDEMNSTMALLPMVPLRDIVIFPHQVSSFFVGRDKSVKAVSAAMGGGKRIFLATQKKSDIKDPHDNEINHIGTIRYD